MIALEEMIDNLPGFKIADSHFRIGAKIHITDFYYAKRFFQNSFFASRVAYILANDIAQVVEKRFDGTKEFKDSEKKLTLIGYEMYSELLVSLIEKFLRLKWDVKAERVNHNIIEDAEKLTLRKSEELNEYVIIIVPIASTFSTAIKIEQELLRIAGDKNPIEIASPHFNVLYISDGEPGLKPNENEKYFGWDKINLPEKKIRIKVFQFQDVIGNNDKKNEDDGKWQKYYLSLPTQWHRVYRCRCCFPAQDVDQKDAPLLLLHELPLFETDSTAVTPSVVFSFPNGRVLEKGDRNRKYVLNKDLVYYGQRAKHFRHLPYGIRSEKFFLENLEFVGLWLKKIKNDFKDDSNYRESDRVLIVSSCHPTNIGFINLLNEVLFDTAANIIHYDPVNDYIQNFDLIYGHEIKQADKIVFADDSIKSGNTFNRIHQFVYHTLRETSVEKVEGKAKPVPRGIEACFFLRSEMLEYTFRDIEDKLVKPAKIYAFANFHLYNALSLGGRSPMEAEKKRYDALVNDSFLDSLKVHFIRQSQKLSSKKENASGLSDTKAERHLEMLKATHRLYQYFASGQRSMMSNFNSFDDFVKDVWLHTTPPGGHLPSSTLSIPAQTELDWGVNEPRPKKSSAKQPPPDHHLTEEIKKQCLKVLTQSPFTQFKPIRESIFKWVILLLHEKLALGTSDTGSFDYEIFEEIKFLIRRAGLLNSNYLISDEFFNKLRSLYADKRIPKLIKGYSADENKMNEAENLKNFPVFYVAQVKELLLKNEARGIVLEKTLLSYGGNSNPPFGQIIRMLLEENAILIHKVFNHIQTTPDWETLQKTNVRFDTDAIKTTLGSLVKTLYHKFQSLNDFFEAGGNAQIENNTNFHHYLWLQLFFSYERNLPQNEKASKHQPSLDDKTDYIFRMLKKLFPEDSKPGAFFIINDNQQTSLLVYNRNAQNQQEVESLNWRAGDESYLNIFLNGTSKRHTEKENKQTQGEPLPRSPVKEEKNDHHKTIIEFMRDTTSAKWKDLYATTDDEPDSVPGWDIVPEHYNRLLLIRINRRDSENLDDKPQGVIGFYFKGNDEITPMNTLRYLLLLRDSFSRFIATHHENDEFRNWQIAEIKQRTSLLTGHGREMLISIAEREKEGKDYIPIVASLLMVQRLLIDKKELKTIGDDNKDNQVGQRANLIFWSFHSHNKRELKDEYFVRLSKMAWEIFSFNEVENCDEIKPIIHGVNYTPKFRFDRLLLQMICFELFVNAKKNRWLFLNGPERVIKDGKPEVFIENKMWIEGRSCKNEEKRRTELYLKISNTGPALDDTTLQDINKKKEIKRYGNSSGIELIDTLLREFKIGTMIFDQESLSGNTSQKLDEGEFARFNVHLTLYDRWDEKEDSYY